MNAILYYLKHTPIIKQIAVGLVIGILIASFAPGAIPFVGIFGDLFVKALKGIAPLLVFILVMNAMIQRKDNGDTNETRHQTVHHRDLCRFPGRGGHVFPVPRDPVPAAG